MALAYGTSASGTASGNVTVSITPAATAGTMLVVALSENGNSKATHGTVAYNGNAMTFINTEDDGVNTDSPISLFYYFIGTPDGAAHNIVGTLGGTAVRGKITGITVTGADSTIGASGIANGNSGTPTVTITTGTNNSFLVDGFYGATSTNTATGTGNTTLRTSALAGDGTYVWAGTATTGTAGSFSSSYSRTSALWAGITVEIKPQGADVFSVSDSSAATDTPKIQEVNLLSKTETVTISELISMLFVKVLSVFDSTAVSDSISLRNDWLTQRKDSSSWTGGVEHSSLWTDLPIDSATFSNQPKS